jgi:hypothetical protein
LKSHQARVNVNHDTRSVYFGPPSLSFKAGG